MPDLEHIALRLRKARLVLDAIKDRAQLAKDDSAPHVGGGQPAASSTTDDVHVAGPLEIARRKKRVEALAQKSAELLAKYNPYHGPNGRFTGAGGATFVSTTNKRTTARMRSGQMSGGNGGASGGAKSTSGPVRPASSDWAMRTAGKPLDPAYERNLSAQGVRFDGAKLPAISGVSEKQAQYAEKVRGQINGRGEYKKIDGKIEVSFPSGSINYFEHQARKKLDSPGLDEKTKSQGNAIISAANSIRQETSARFWLDNQNSGALNMLQSRAKKLGLI